MLHPGAGVHPGPGELSVAGENVTSCALDSMRHDHGVRQPPGRCAVIRMEGWGT